MSKISHLRKRLRDEYHKRNLPQAANLGDALLVEHMTIQNSSPGYANDLFNVALVYDELGQYEKAAAMYSASARHISGNSFCGMQALDLFGISESCHPALVIRYNNLAGALAHMGDFEQAYNIYTAVRGIYTRMGHTTALTDNLYNMGNVAADAYKTEDALRLHGQALVRRKQEGVPEDITHSLHSLAMIYEETGEYEKAIPFAETALEYTKGGAHASACNYLAELYAANGQYEKALEQYENVLSEIAKSGCMRRDYMTVLSRRAYLTGKAGDPAEAIKLHEEVFDMYHSLTGLDLECIDSAFYPNCLRNMAVLNNSIGETALAEDYMLKSIKSRKAAGEEIIRDVCFLINLYLESDDYDKLSDIVVYALMHSSPMDTNATATIDALMESFSKAGSTHKLLEILAVIREANCTEKLKSILDTWRQREGFL